MSSQFWSIWLVYYFSFLLLLFFRGVGWANQVFRVGPCRGQQLVVVNSSLLVGASQARWPSLLCCPSLRREGESRLFERRNEVNCVNFFVGREKSRRVLTPREKAKDARRSESSMAASLFFFILGMWHTRTCYCSTHTHTRRDLLIISFFSFSDIFCDSFRFDSFSFLSLPWTWRRFLLFRFITFRYCGCCMEGRFSLFFCCCCNRHSTMYTIATIPHGGYDWTFVNYSKKKKRKKKICCTTISFGKKCYIMTCSIGSGKICDVVSHLFLLLFLFPFHYIGGKGWKSFKGILFLLLIVCIWCDFSSSVPPISYRSACRPLLNHIFYSSFFPLLQFTLVTHYMMAMTYISSLK